MTKTAKATPAPAVTAAPAIKLLVGEKAIKAAFVSIHRRGQSLQQDIHVATCSVLDHVGKHSDVRLVTELLAAVPEMGRKNAMRDWFAFFGPVAFERDTVTFVKGKATDLKGAMLEPFWLFSPEKPYEAIDVAKMIDGLIKKLAKDEKETGKSGAHTALMTGLAKLKPTVAA